MIFDEDLNACAALVRAGDPDRFMATMAAPVAARAVLFPLYAFNIEVARAPWLTKEPLIAQMRLQWWRDALAEIAAGKTPRRHHVTTPLARILPPELAAELDHLVAARYWDINKQPFRNIEEFDRHLANSSGRLVSVAARALGPADRRVASDFGWAVGLANWFLAVPELQARGRSPLPDGTESGVRTLACEGLRRLASARACKSTISSTAAAAFLAGWQTETLLRRAAADPRRVAGGTLRRSEARKRLSLIWRSATGHW